ncbi:MAG: DUF1624 domain-containing protein [Anaerolineales bacterium]|nr:DUF1624 domain-containing protein [Anaerolineales bacterium]
MTVTTTTTSEIASPRRSTRFWEIDAMRGVAIITMIVYHTMWDLFFTGVLPNINLWEGFWKYWQRFTAGTFLILVGVSLTLVYRRERAKRGPDVSLFPKFFWRGLKIFGIGMIITLVVWFAFTQLGAEGFIDFGILHLIGISTILAYPLLRFKWLNFGLWIAFSIAGKLLENVHWDGAFNPILGSLFGRPVWIDGRWLAPFGVMPAHYPAVDYFPLIPWFGVVLLGVWFGNWFYADNKRLVALPDWGHLAIFRGLEFLGRHSLLIYVIHQPILLAVLAMLGVF